VFDLLNQKPIIFVVSKRWNEKQHMLIHKQFVLRHQFSTVNEKKEVPVTQWV